MLHIKNNVHSPIPWVGSKKALVSLILRIMPLGCTRYIEPFGGGASVLLSKQPDRFEVYNDYNGDLVNMFMVLRDRPLSFVRAANLFPLNSRQEFLVLKEFMKNKEPDFSEVDREVGIAYEEFCEVDAKEVEEILTTKAQMYDVQRAVAFYKIIRYSYSGTGKSFGGQPVNLPNVLEHIYAVAKRLTNVVIENKDFEDLIKLHDKPGTFIYLDPPYYMTEDFYTGFTRDDHIRLYRCLSNLKHGSVNHIVNLDVKTGEVIETFGGQGYCEGSSWTRGQAWAIYGFVLSYIHTYKEEYLETSKKVADYFIDCVKSDWLPRIDFRSPEEPLYYDSTAGAIAACGFIEIAKVTGEKRYLDAAITMLKTMNDEFCNWKDDNEAILLMGSERYDRESGRHISIIYGDYYFVEAIYKLKGFDMLFW